MQGQPVCVFAWTESGWLHQEESHARSVFAQWMAHHSKQYDNHEVSCPEAALLYVPGVQSVDRVPYAHVCMNECIYGVRTHGAGGGAAFRHLLGRHATRACAQLAAQ
jgi:hypothetical protein